MLCLGDTVCNLFHRKERQEKTKKLPVQKCFRPQEEKAQANAAKKINATTCALFSVWFFYSSAN